MWILVVQIVCFAYFLSPCALAGLCQQKFDGRGALRHGAVVVTVLL